MSSYRRFTLLVRKSIAPFITAFDRVPFAALYARLTAAVRRLPLAALYAKLVDALRRLPLEAVKAKLRDVPGRAWVSSQIARMPNAHRYPAAGLAIAGIIVAVVAPLTATANSSVPVAATQNAVVEHAAKQAAKTPAKKTPATKAPATKAKSTAKAAAPKTKTSTPAKSTPKAAPATKKSTPAKSTPAPAPKKTKAATPVSTKPYAGVSYKSLEPNGTVGSQSHFTPSSSQWGYATTIVKTAKEMNLSPYAATIAVATAIQESTLRNLTHAVDHDSLGLFQQRPSTGWGSPSELTDPSYAAKAFLRELPSNYQHMALADAAQSVQRSFDGSLYAQWEAQAAKMVHTIANS